MNDNELLVDFYKDYQIQFMFIIKIPIFSGAEKWPLPLQVPSPSHCLPGRTKKVHTALSSGPQTGQSVYLLGQVGVWVCQCVYLLCQVSVWVCGCVSGCICYAKWVCEWVGLSVGVFAMSSGCVGVLMCMCEWVGLSVGVFAMSSGCVGVSVCVYLLCQVGVVGVLTCVWAGVWVCVFAMSSGCVGVVTCVSVMCRKFVWVLCLIFCPMCVCLWPEPWWKSILGL